MAICNGSPNYNELIKALKTVTVHLIAAHSLLAHGGKKAAPSDKMFYMLLDDYEKAFNLGRETLAKLEPLQASATPPG